VAALARRRREPLRHVLGKTWREKINATSMTKNGLGGITVFHKII
jgi:hypothetical protein